MNVMLAGVNSLFYKHLGKNVSGVYVHGSLAMGCFNREKSDADLLVTVKQPLISHTQKRALVDDLLNISGCEAPPIECSIILDRYMECFEHPTPFEFHFWRCIENDFKRIRISFWIPV